MSSAGDLKGKGEEDEGKAIKRADFDTHEPERNRKKRDQPAEEVDAACTRESADMAGAGRTGEEDEGKAIKTADFNNREPEKQRQPSASTEVAEAVDAGTRESAASTKGEEVVAEMPERQPTLTEEILAEQYSVPFEIFSTGSWSGCAFVFDLEEFKQAARMRRPIYVMPCMPPKSALDIQVQMKEEHELLLVNPEVLSSKAAVMKDIDSEIRKSLSLLRQADPRNPNPEEEKPPFRIWDGHRRIASRIINFRLHMQKLVRDAKGKCDDLYYDFLSVLSLEEWHKTSYRSQCSLQEQTTFDWDDVAEEPSLIGASTKARAVTALKNQLRDFIAFAVDKGHLANETGARLATRDGVKKLRKAVRENIDPLITLMKKKHMDFDEVAKNVDLLKQKATKVGAARLESTCGKLLEWCKQKNDEECRKILPYLEGRHNDICAHLERIMEMQELIGLVQADQQVKP